MILLSFDNGVRKQDVLVKSLPLGVNFILGSYEYNETLERIEFFGIDSMYYNHQDNEWVKFNYDGLVGIEGDRYMYCVGILIK